MFLVGFAPPSVWSLVRKVPLNQARILPAKGTFGQTQGDETAGSGVPRVASCWAMFQHREVCASCTGILFPVHNFIDFYHCFIWFSRPSGEFLPPPDPINNQTQLWPKAVDRISPITLWQFFQEFLGFLPVRKKLWCFGIRILWRSLCRVQPTHEVSNVGHSFISSLDGEKILPLTRMRTGEAENREMKVHPQRGGFLFSW